MSIGSQDLGGALLWIALFVGGIAAVAGLAVWVARRRGSTTIVLDAALAVAQVWLLLLAVAVVFLVWRWFTETQTTIIGLPVSMEWPDPLPFEPTGSGTELLWASVPEANAEIFALSAGTRAILASGDLLGIVIAAMPALVIVVICRHALRGAPFTRVASRWLLIAAIVILVAGTAIDLVYGIGRTLAAMEALPGPESGAAVTTHGIYSLTVPLWPLGAALALGALGAVFRHGAVLQRETEGLV